MILVEVAVASACDDNTQLVFYNFSWSGCDQCFDDNTQLVFYDFSCGSGVTIACDDNTQLVFDDFSCGSGCDQCL